MAESGDMLRIQVCYAERSSQILRELTMQVGSTVADAISASGITAQLPGGELGDHKVGIYGKLKTLDTVLRNRDRVEIYRPLLADPKEARRRRAEKKSRIKS